MADLPFGLAPVAFLKGAKGDQGDDGPRGPQGPRGLPAAGALADDATIAAFLSGGDTQSGAAVQQLASEQTADDMQNPESPLQSRTLTLVEQRVLEGFPGMPLFFNGALSNRNVARPNWAGVVVWRVWSGAPLPTNFAAGDEVDEVEVTTELLARDTFARGDGLLGSTPVGGFLWTTAGGGTWGIVSEQVAITATGATGGYAVINTGVSRTRTRVSIPVQAAGYPGITGRYVDENNHFLVSRVSSSQITYRLTKRIAGTVTDVGVSTVPIASGDVIVFDDLVVGRLRVSVLKGSDEFVVFDEQTAGFSVPELATATRVGFYTGNTSSAVAAARWGTIQVDRAVS
ncbi:hypothetical protein [Microbacterium testaceum]|nr:hypothetical protein [Microbacterium testaceum]